MKTFRFKLDAIFCLKNPSTIQLGENNKAVGQTGGDICITETELGCTEWD